MILPEKLLQEALNEFEEKKKRSFVIRESLPILFFGDLLVLAKHHWLELLVNLKIFIL